MTAVHFRSLRSPPLITVLPLVLLLSLLSPPRVAVAQSTSPSASSGASFSCTNVPSAPFNGAVSTVVPQLYYTFSCHTGYLLSGSSELHCVEVNQWDTVAPSCITIQEGGGCTTRSVTAQQIAQCLPNEMVVSGTVDCGAGFLMGSKPTSNMQGWYGTCSTGTTTTMPATVTASCCQFADDTFTRTPAGQLVNPNPSKYPVLPARSFLQNCDYYQSDANQAQIYVWGTLMYGVQCPVGKSVLAGGVVNGDLTSSPLF